jgi:hypothetical protein
MSGLWCEQLQPNSSTRCKFEYVSAEKVDQEDYNPISISIGGAAHQTTASQGSPLFSDACSTHAIASVYSFRASPASTAAFASFFRAITTGMIRRRAVATSLRSFLVIGIIQCNGRAKGGRRLRIYAPINEFTV